MTDLRRPLPALSLGILLAAGCAHAPADKVASREARPPMTFVTGSRIPQRVEPASGLPATTSPVRIYSRQELDQTGRSYDLGSALRALDSSL